MGCGCECGSCGGQAPREAGVAGKVFSPLELLDFQEGGIVSRSILDGNGGSVTLFTFDAGQSLSEHKAPYDALVVALEGEADFTLQGVLHRVSPGQMLVMPANVPHSMKTEKRFRMMLVMIRE
ncbi:MAG: cupin domain-containing protein [Synergistaceae bacterium]|nr:cupin domain-containing protein [Synergistaceae bacterium]